MLFLDLIGSEALVCSGVLLCTLLLLYMSWLSTAVPHRPLNVRAIVVDQRLLSSDHGLDSSSDQLTSSSDPSLLPGVSDEGRGGDIDLGYDVGGIADLGSGRDQAVGASSLDTVASSAMADSVSRLVEEENTSTGSRSCADTSSSSDCDSDLGASASNCNAGVLFQSESSSSSSPSSSSGHDGDGNIAGLYPSPPRVNPDPNCQSTPIQSITFKLKFLNDVERTVEADVSERLDCFKRRNFVAESSAGHTIRLIYKGHVLSDTASLSECGLHNDCVVHCVISTSSARGSGAGTEGASAGTDHLDQLNIGFLLQPMLTCLLAVLWMVQQQVPHLFTTTASLILSAFTLMMTVSLVRTLLTRRQH